ncbi:unnamed protein product [Didymodactylos carnosus]|uniref:Uncharacterized protein n=1 Tax=Didymodactylos carnosus TaxID=1234261 RepID=A0A8S2DS84_9BILA|nr:unnamed protein product [Didymodactylos carnosus]CAF3734592.1 unnamed protein product [Didymodactylos carnosus]
MSGSINQMNQELKRRRSESPFRTIDRVDGATLNIGDSQDHVHFTDGWALKRDGTWKHENKNAKPRTLSNKEKEWLTKHGWTLPKE